MSTTLGRNAPATPFNRAATRTRLWLTLAAVLVALTSVACSGRPDGSSTGPAQGSSPAHHGDPALTFSQCMRDNGVANFPDPDASGHLTIDSIANDAKIDTGSAA